MMSYRFARRSFLGAVGGAVGLKVLLRNLEASAAGTPSPPRFLAMSWPLGTVRYFFLPPPPAVDIASSRILKPIADAGLAGDTIVLYGFSTNMIPSGGGGGAEAGTVKTMTGAASPGTRVNGGEGDDAVAGGPSFDQIFLNHVPALKRLGPGYANVICDARVDSFETSAQCLSYSYATRSVPSARTPGTDLTENVPLMPMLSPLLAYQQLFGGFSGTTLDAQRMQSLLLARKSVLDHSLRELARLRTLAPASESPRIDQHAEIIRKLETDLKKQMTGQNATCAVPAPPDAALVGQSGSHYDYFAFPRPVPTADDVLHGKVGHAHASILRAAFQCDLIRVATFEWAPGTSHVAFAGLYPPDPAGAYMHNPMSQMITMTADVMTTYPADDTKRGVVDYLANVHTWYNRQTADIVLGFKQATDVYGGNLLDQTIIPFVTDRSDATDGWQPLPALIFGGRALGMVGGQFLDFGSRVRSINDLWMTIAQAYLRTTDPLSALAGEVFVKTNVSPIAGVWRGTP
jgi:hypothetical protein